MPDAIQPIDPSAIPLGYEPVLGPQTMEEALELYASLKPRHGCFLVLVRDGEWFWVWVLNFHFWID